MHSQQQVSVSVVLLQPAEAGSVIDQHIGRYFWEADEAAYSCNAVPRVVRKPDVGNVGILPQRKRRRHCTTSLQKAAVTKAQIAVLGCPAAHGTTLCNWAPLGRRTIQWAGNAATWLHPPVASVSACTWQSSNIACGMKSASYSQRFVESKLKTAGPRTAEQTSGPSILTSSRH